MEEDVLLQDVDARGVLTLTLNRPQRRNALSGALVEALLEVFLGLRERADVRVVVLTGAGDRAFCSGADLDPAAAAAGPYAMHRARERFARLLLAMQRCGRPIIARLQGHAVAGGLGLVAAADLAVAADDIELGTPEIERGLFPMMILSVLARTVPRKPLLHMLLTGDRIGAARAADLGLINEAVPRAELDGRVDALAGRLAGMSQAVMMLGRDAFYSAQDMPQDRALEFLCGQLTVNTLTEDAMEGMMAFMQKRPPAWNDR
jgi:enoyl-CoA hydratase/carnithine racemase